MKVSSVLHVRGTGEPMEMRFRVPGQVCVCLAQKVLTHHLLTTLSQIKRAHDDFLSFALRSADKTRSTSAEHCINNENITGQFSYSSRVGSQDL